MVEKIAKGIRKSKKDRKALFDDRGSTLKVKQTGLRKVVDRAIIKLACILLNSHLVTMLLNHMFL